MRSGAHAPNEVIAVLARQPDVADNHVGTRAVDGLAPFGRAPDADHLRTPFAQQDRHQLAYIRFIVDDEDAHAIQPRLETRSSRCAILEIIRWQGSDRTDRKPDVKGGAFAGSVALHRDATAVELDDVLRDRQSQAEPSDGARRGAIPLPEPLEDERQKVRCDAFPRVAHPQMEHAFRPVQLYEDVASGFGELHGVGQ